MYSTLICCSVGSRWTIRVRAVSKPSIRTWSNSRGEGRVLNVDFVDETVSTSLNLPVIVIFSLWPQGEIRAVAFNEVADKMQGLLEMGQVSFSY